VSIALACLASPLARLLQAPEEAFSGTVSYLRICGGGAFIIVAYNILGSIFRGIGDSRTPLLTVGIACVVNIAGDLLNVAVFHMGAAGAAVATVFAQAVSVVISLQIIRRRPLPFIFERSMIRANRPIMRRIFKYGFPLGLSDFLVGISFLVILAIVNSLGLIASAGVGVGEKVCAFIMLVPSSFMQSLASVVSQNFGAGKYDRCRKALHSAIGLSLFFGILMFYFNYFHGILAASVFSQDPAVLSAAAEYLRAYAIDCLFTAFLFCYIGFFNGIGMTRFVMIQGLIGAFCVRIPVSILMRYLYPDSLFRIALATPCSSVVQILLCLFAMLYARRKVLVDKLPDR
jgi:putative MATE family efflux protein